MEKHSNTSSAKGSIQHRFFENGTNHNSNSYKQKLETINYDPKTLDLEQLKKEHKGQAILIVRHSYTTPDLANRIINQKGVAPIDATVFGNLYIITINRNELSHQLLQGL